MTRVKGGTVSKNRRRKVLKEAKGYFGSKHRLYKTAQEQVFHSGAYAYRDRKANKRNFRKLWITRINAACRENEISYSKFMNGLTKAGIDINEPATFAKLVETSKKALDGKVSKPAPKAEPKKAEKTPAKEQTETKASKGYSAMTLAELKAVAKEQGVKGYSSMKKEELLANIK